VGQTVDIKDAELGDYPKFATAAIVAKTVAVGLWLWLVL
jgi:hypothetical protein